MISLLLQVDESHKTWLIEVPRCVDEELQGVILRLGRPMPMQL